MPDTQQPILKWLNYGLFLLLGYAVAVLVASVTTLFLLTVSEPGVGPLGFITEGLPLGIMLTAMTAWPGYLMTVIVGIVWRVHAWYYYTLGGILTSILAVAIFTDFDPGGIGEMLSDLPTIPLGGLFGALVFHWLFTKRLLALGGPKPNPSLSPSEF